MKPIDLLKKELVVLERARDSSIRQNKDGIITSDLHEQHMENLIPMIEEYKYIIRIINQYA
jgi:hypothetical protein